MNDTACGVEGVGSSLIPAPVRMHFMLGVHGGPGNVDGLGIRVWEA